jgi:hypothetical protein
VSGNGTIANHSSAPGDVPFRHMDRVAVLAELRRQSMSDVFSLSREERSHVIDTRGRRI